MVSFTPWPLYPQGKSPWYPLDRRLGDRRAVLDTVAKRKIPIPRRESNPRTPIVQPVAQRYTDWAITTLVAYYYYYYYYYFVVLLLVSPLLIMDTNSEFSVVSSIASYLEGPGIKSQYMDWDFSIYLSPSTQIVGPRYLSHPSVFIIDYCAAFVVLSKTYFYTPSWTGSETPRDDISAAVDTSSASCVSRKGSSVGTNRHKEATTWDKFLHASSFVPLRPIYWVFLITDSSARCHRIKRESQSVENTVLIQLSTSLLHTAHI
jgi:hypothetical protein